MKQKLFYLLMVCLAPLLVVSCKPNDVIKPDGKIYTIEVAEPIVNMQADDTEKSVKVKTNLPEFNVKLLDAAASSWLTVKPTAIIVSNAIIKAKVNDDINSRTAKILVCSMDEKVRDTIVLTQLGTAPDLLINVPETFKTDKNGATLNVTITTNAPYEIQLSDGGWISNLDTRAMEAYEHAFKIAPNAGIPRVGTITMRTTDVEPMVEKMISVSQSGAGGDIEVPVDILYRPTAARVSDFQGVAGAENVFDGDLTSIWHSEWSLDKPENFPKWLEVDVPATATSIDYIVPYMRAGNGAWGKWDLSYNTRTDNTWVKISEGDNGYGSGAKPIFFETPLQDVKSFRFSIKDGSNGNASCAEVELFKYREESPLEAAIAKVFKTTACMELKDGVTDADIAKLPDLLQQVAVGIRTGTYEKEFRRGVYTAHSSPEYWASKLRTNKWGQADNPTGIWAKKGEKIVVLVGETWGNRIYLFSCDAFAGAHGDDYLLNEGVNEITVRNDGLFYVKYYVNDLHAENAKPIELHIPETQGYVNGYWDVQKHKTDAEYARIYKLSTEPFRMFDIVGKYTHLIYSRGFVPETKIVDAFAWYDKMCWWNWEIMGADKFYNNGDLRLRHVFVSNDEGFMDATDYRTHYHQSTLMERLQESTMKRVRDLMWGPAHEVGHQQQAAINFKAFTEASNNLFSNLFVWQSNWGHKTRGPGAQLLIDAGFAYKEPLKVYIDRSKTEGMISFPQTPFALIGTTPITDIIITCRMYWQLYTYYHIAGKNTEFWPNCFAELRKLPDYPQTEPQLRALNVYYAACDAAQEDLTEFFTAWGWFVPIDCWVDDYSMAHHVLTQPMIDEAQAKVRAKGYPKAAPIEYIEDRDRMDNEDTKWNPTKGDAGYWMSYRDNAKIKANISVSVSGNAFTVANWEGAAAFELKDQDRVTYKSVKRNFTVPAELKTATAKLYAVQVDGERILIWPK